MVRLCRRLPYEDIERAERPEVKEKMGSDFYKMAPWLALIGLLMGGVFAVLEWLGWIQH